MAEDEQATLTPPVSAAHSEGGAETEAADTAAPARQGILSLTIRDKGALYSAYMPFIKRGGLFIPTNKDYELGQELFVLLKLMDDPAKLPVSGIVVWKTPRGAQGNRVTGIGIQFTGKEADQVRGKIETYLAGALKSDRPTHTM